MTTDSYLMLMASVGACALLAVLPGVTRTPMIARLSGDQALSQVLDRLRSRHSMNRLGEPREIGETVAWRLSDPASVMNGAAVPGDGGFLST